MPAVVRKSKPGSRGPPKGTKTRPATARDVVVDKAYKTETLTYEAAPGDWVDFVLVHRELSWSERATIGEKHTQTRHIGRDQVTQLDGIGAARDQILAAVDLAKCEPPLTREIVVDLKGPLFDVIAERLNSGQNAEEVERAAGESEAP